MPAKAVIMIPDAPVARRVPRGAKLADLTLPQQNWMFGQQLASSDGRDGVKVKVDGSLTGDFIPALRDAARKAGAGGQVLLSTGHGTRAPGNTFTTLSEFHFETVHETSLPRTKNITKATLDFLDVAETKDGRWVPKDQKRPGSTIVFRESQATIDALAPRWAVIEAMRDAFTSNRIDRLVLHSCSLGLYPAECQKLANLIGTTVVAYRGRIAFAELDPPFVEPGNMAMRSVMCWCIPNGSLTQPPPDPFLRLVFSSVAPGSPEERLVLSNWKQHWVWAGPTMGPVLECTPGGLPRAA
jgi:hypothetical protein